MGRMLGDRLFLGYTPGGERVYVDVHVGRESGGQSVRHDAMDAYDVLSVMGEVYEGQSGFRDSQCVASGQCLGAARSVLADGGRLARGVSEADVRLIVESWQRWHLNHMRAGCAHMEPVGEDTSDKLDRTPPCPETGYRWGRAWLVEPLPEGLVGQLAEACERLAR